MSFTQWLSQGNDYVLILCAFIGAVCAAGAKLHGLYKASRKPYDNLVSRMDRAEERLDHLDGCVDRDNKRLNEQDQNDRLMLKSQMQIIEFLVSDDAPTDKLIEVNNSIRDHLISR